jgi:hypothetical protein
LIKYIGKKSNMPTHHENNEQEDIILRMLEDTKKDWSLQDENNKQEDMFLKLLEDRNESLSEQNDYIEEIFRLLALHNAIDSKEITYHSRLELRELIGSEEDPLSNSSPLIPRQQLEVDLKINQLSLKCKKDMKALLIYSLNADVTGYKRRLPQFKRHLVQFLDCFSDLEDFEINYDVIPTFFSYFRLFQDEKSEEGYRLICMMLKNYYDDFCSNDSINRISTDHWRSFRGKPPYRVYDCGCEILD